MYQQPIVKHLLKTICFLILLSSHWAVARDISVPTGLLKLTPVIAPTIQLTDIDGKAYRLDHDKGSLVFVHFWASWCAPCRKEMPAIQHMWHKLGKQGLKIALINTAEDEDTVFSFLSTYAPDIRALMDKDGQVTEQWQPRGLPATYLVDQDGYVRYQALGGRAWDEKAYLDFLHTLLKQGK